MNTLTFMDKLFCDPSLKITNLNKGLTNQNFRLDLDEDTFVLRSPREDSERIVKRHHEALALAQIKDKNIDVETIYYDECSGYKVTRYLPNAKTFDEYHETDRIVRVAQLMKKFHNLNITIGMRFDPIARYEQYKSHVLNPIYDLKAFEQIIEDIRQLDHNEILCHNDWVEGNILFDENQTYLIDYEYAGDNDPLFDVMSFISENNLNEDERSLFLKEYFDELTPALLHDLLLWENFHNLLWCMWAMMMFEHRNEAIYQAIAKDKFVALQISFNKYYNN